MKRMEKWLTRIRTNRRLPRRGPPHRKRWLRQLLLRAGARARPNRVAARAPHREAAEAVAEATVQVAAVAKGAEVVAIVPAVVAKGAEVVAIVPAVVAEA